jgi:hypothetical protein
MIKVHYISVWNCHDGTHYWAQFNICQFKKKEREREKSLYAHSQEPNLHFSTLTL